MVGKCIKFYRSVDIAISRGFLTQYSNFTNYKQASNAGNINKQKKLVYLTFKKYFSKFILYKGGRGGNLRAWLDI